MICRMPKDFDQYVEFISTDRIPDTHFVVRIAKTPPEALKELMEWDRKLFECDGEHAIEFLED